MAAAKELNTKVAAPTREGRPNARHTGNSRQGQAPGAPSSRGAGGGLRESAGLESGFGALGGERGHKNRREGAAGLGV